MSTSTSLIDSFNFSCVRAIAGKLERISQGLYCIDFLLSSSQRNSVIIGILMDLQNFDILYPKYIQRSKNLAPVEAFLKNILRNEMNRIPQNANIHSFVYDETLRKDIEIKKTAYTWERALSSTEFMPIRDLINTLLRHSIASGRIRNIENVVVVLIENKDLDQEYLQGWLKTFSEILEEDLIKRYEDLKKNSNFPIDL